MSASTSVIDPAAVAADVTGLPTFTATLRAKATIAGRDASLGARPNALGTAYRNAMVPDIASVG
jgi:hypothetical protein